MPLCDGEPVLLKGQPAEFEVAVGEQRPRPDDSFPAWAVCQSLEIPREQPPIYCLRFRASAQGGEGSGIVPEDERAPRRLLQGDVAPHERIVVTSQFVEK